MILEALRMYRLMRADDVTLLLGQSSQTAYRLLQDLYHNRMIGKAWMDAKGKGRGGQRTAVHFLSTGGIEFLRLERQKAGLETPFFAPTGNDMTQVFMRHTIGITNSMLRFQLAIEANGWSVYDYKNEWNFKVKNFSRLKSQQARAEKIPIKVTIETGLVYKHGRNKGQPRTNELNLEPDAFIVIDSQWGKVPLFHEHDRNTESEEKWQQKIRAYNALYRTGLFEHLFGWKAFRVVTTVHSKDKVARVDALIRYTEAVPNIGSKFLFIHETDLDIQTLLTERVWQRALSQRAKNNYQPRMVALVRPRIKKKL